MLRQNTVPLLIALMAGLSHAALIPAEAQGRPYVQYAPATGAIVLNEATHVASMVFTGPGVPAGDVNAQGGFSTVGSDYVDFLLFSPLNGDGYHLGYLFPRGLRQSEIERNYFAGFLPAGCSCGGIPFRMEIMGGLVPEPGAVILAVPGLLGLAFVRRRMAGTRRGTGAYCSEDSAK